MGNSPKRNKANEGHFGNVKGKELDAQMQDLTKTIRRNSSAAADHRAVSLHKRLQQSSINKTQIKAVTTLHGSTDCS